MDLTEFEREYNIIKRQKIEPIIVSYGLDLRWMECACKITNDDDSGEVRIEKHAIPIVTLERKETRQDVDLDGRSKIRSMREAVQKAAVCEMDTTYKYPLSAQASDFYISLVLTNIPSLTTLEGKTIAVESDEAELFEKRGFATLLLHIAFYMGIYLGQSIKIEAATPQTTYILRKHYETMADDSRGDKLMSKSADTGEFYFKPRDYKQALTDIEKKITTWFKEAETSQTLTAHMEKLCPFTFVV